MFRKRRWQLAACCLLTALLTTAAVVGTEAVLLNRLTGSASESVRFLRTMNLLKRNYNGEIDNHQLFDGAIKGMVEAAGDPYTVYLNSKDFQQLSEMTGGSFGGIGIVFGKRGNDYVVISALEDNPGAKAGIKSGDIITAIDGKPTRDMNMEQVANKIRGKHGTVVKLELKGKDGKLRTVSVERAEIKNPSVGGQLLLDTKIGYIRIAVFNENTGDDFAKKYAELEKQGMQALVLDLRGNPGGVFDAGVADGSASAAEIVAGAIKDTKSGKLFGTKTFGKGSVQSVYRLDSNTAVKITVAKYYTPSGVSIHNVGIEPDVKVELPEDATVDVQLKAAEDYLLQQLQ